MDAFLGTILAAGFNFAPRGWALCQGQILSIAQNTALFSLLGTQYGGNGQTTFGLPDLRGRVAVGQGSGPSLTPRIMGEVWGTEGTMLVRANVPPHTHTAASTFKVDNTAGTLAVPAGASSLAAIVDINTDPAKGYNLQTPTVVLNPNTIATTVNDSANATAAVPIMQPSLCVNYIIATVGLFPSRN